MKVRRRGQRLLHRTWRHLGHESRWRAHRHHSARAPSTWTGAATTGQRCTSPARPPCIASGSISRVFPFHEATVHEAQHRPHPDHPRRQPGAAARDPRGDPDPGQPTSRYDEAAFEQQVREGVNEVVRKQAEVGIDIPSDGEYLQAQLRRLRRPSAWAASSRRPIERPKRRRPMNYPILDEEFPGFMAQYNAHVPHHVDAAVDSARPGRRRDRARRAPSAASSPARSRYKGQAARPARPRQFQGRAGGPAVRRSVRAVGDAVAQRRRPGHVYPSEQAYLYALADAMHEEYKAIVDAGFVVQLDLGLPARNQVLPGKPTPDLGGAAARLGDAGRGVQPRAARHPRGPRALPPVLGQHEHARTPATSRSRTSST